MDPREFFPPEELEAYLKGKHGERMGFGVCPAVIVVDLTYAFVDPAQELTGGKSGWPAVQANARLLEKAREKSVPIIYTKPSEHTRTHPVMGSVSRKRVEAIRQYLVKPGSNDIVPEIAPHSEDYVITKTSRFKAAASGASEVNYLAGYGTDHYQREWETELGLPWRQRDLWIRLSPWFEVDKVATPTLLMCGEDDRNVPLLHSLQLYQALRRLGRETELVIYPGEDHSIDRPSFQKDRYERWLAWYDRFLKPGSPAPSPPPMDAARRARFEEDLAKATADFVKDPESVDALIWLGRRTAYLGRYREAIEIYTRGIAKHPSDFRLYRHRGHRHITLRQLDEAIADLTRASELIRGVPDEVEPDGIPNRRGIPTGTSHFNIYYHLGLALYLKGDFEKAERAYRECLRFSGHPDRLVATSDWLYLTLRRQGRVEEAARILEPIRAGLELIEGPVYLDRLRLYKGELRPEDLLAAGGGGVDRPAYLYGVGAFHLVNGRTDEAREIFETIVRSEERSAFAVIAAEAELGRTKAR